ncbi:MAG: hypothetical protein FWF50_00075 [Defluviitaleaceae bacterium]|nr:hypothetical protein [Defluviitaleaceae bacterium]
MLNFPRIKSSQLAVSRAERSTGIMLNEKFERHLNNNEEYVVFTIFESLDDARNYVDRLKIEREDIEFYVYNHLQELVYMVR